MTLRVRQCTAKVYSRKSVLIHGGQAMPDVELSFEEYKAEIVKADNERLAQAGWIALCELQHELPCCLTYADEVRWAAKVNRLADKIFRRPS